MSTGTPAGNGLGFCFKRLLNAESFGNGFIGDKPLSLPSVLSNTPSPGTLQLVATTPTRFGRLIQAVVGAVVAGAVCTVVCGTLLHSR